MFYCEECRTSRQWPESMMRSRGLCETCGNDALCYDTPSKYLPIPVTRYWLRPAPGMPLSGPYTESEAVERFAEGSVVWPDEQMYKGFDERRLELVPASGKPHQLHVEQGPEYEGETYIWCECLGGKENWVQSGWNINAPDGALFGGSSATELLEFLSKHTPGTSVERVTVSSLYVGCTFPKREDVLAASDTCQHTANSAVEAEPGVFTYRCSEHRGMVDKNRRGEVLWTVTRTRDIKKVRGPDD
jgi:hypothetical protein